jgi:hypothetical protein
MNDLFETKETLKHYAVVEIRLMNGSDEIRTKTVKIPLSGLEAWGTTSIQTDCSLITERYVTKLDSTKVQYCNVHGELLPPTATTHN